MHLSQQGKGPHFAEFADIKQVDTTGDRVSSFQMYSDRLQVIGNLPYCFNFAPSTIGDAQKLIDWLEHWKQQQQP